MECVGGRPHPLRRGRGAATANGREWYAVMFGIAGGSLNLSSQTGRTLVDPNWQRTEEERKMCKALEEVAQQVGAKSIQAGTTFRISHLA